jgi:NADH:ubiquinone oxidoreductase subunit 6 (subunit J)
MEVQAILFYILATMTGVCAVAVVITQNIVRAAAWLLFALAGTAGIFFLLNADFVGATQLLIYVGGTLVLVVFGVMLTAQGPFINMRVGAAEWAIALAVGLLFYGVLAVCLVQMHQPDAVQADLAPTDLPATETLGLALLGSTSATPTAALTGTPGTGWGNEAIRGTTGWAGRPVSPRPVAPAPVDRRKVAYLLPFEIVSVHLLVVLIGAAYLARAKRRRDQMASPAERPTPEEVAA